MTLVFAFLPLFQVRVQQFQLLAQATVCVVVAFISGTQDMGGGTFDVSLLTIEDGIFEVKVPLRVLSGGRGSLLRLFCS